MKKLFYLLGFLLLCTQAQAQTITYVGKGGTDKNSCAQATNPNTPKLTIGNALETCYTHGAGGAAGQILEITDGVYVESIFVGSAYPKGSSWGSPFTIRARDGDTVTVRPNSGGYAMWLNDQSVPSYLIVQDLILDGVNVTDATLSAFGSFIRFTGNQLINNNGCNAFIGRVDSGEFINNKVIGGDFDCGGGAGGSHGYPFYSGGNDTLFDGNELTGFPRFGFHIYQFTGCPTGNIVRNNLVHDGGNPIGADAAILTCGTGHKVYNNKIWNTSGGIDLYYPQGPAGSNEAYNNTVINARDFCIVSQSSGHTARNNICLNSSGGPTYGNIFDWNGSANTYSNNLCYPNACGSGTDNLNVDPRLASVSTNDFQLCYAAKLPNANCAGVSAAINTGFNLTSAGITVDFLGVPRPQGGAFDLGALESTSSSTSPTVLITSPSSTGTYSASSSPVALSGTATSGVSLSSVTWVNNRGGSGTASGTSNWTIPAVTLLSGSNIITVTVTDSNLQTGQAVLTVTYTPAALVGAWSCDEGSGTTVADASGNSNNGSFAGNGWAAGKFSNACSFNGTTSIVSIADSATLDLTGAGTMNGWVYPTVQDGTWRALLHKGNAYFLFSSSSGTCGPSALYGGYFSTTYNTVCYPTLLPINTWTFVSMSFSGTSLTLHTGTAPENLTLRSTLVTSLPMIANTGALLLGSSASPTGSEMFAGRMDEWRVYNYARSAVAGSGNCGADPTTKVVYSQVQCDMIQSINPGASVVIKLNVTSLKLGTSTNLKIGVKP